MPEKKVYVNINDFLYHAGPESELDYHSCPVPQHSKTYYARDTDALRRRLESVGVIIEFN